MIKRVGGGNLTVATAPVPDGSLQLEREGYALLHDVLDPGDVAALEAEVAAVYESVAVDPRPRGDRAQFRYELLNRSGLTQQAIAHPRILDTIEPLLGADCHVIANTAWRNPSDFTGGPWHCDAGPHVPRPEGVPWDDRIPYPVFAIGAHIYLWDCPLECGPTTVIPGSNRSGRLPPFDQINDPELTYNGRSPVLLEAKAGDVALFVSDVWHRGTPALAGGTGRFFVQCHYGRRDIAQRLRTTDHVNHLSREAVSRALTRRERQLVGLHDAFFYDG